MSIGRLGHTAYGPQMGRSWGLSGPRYAGDLLTFQILMTSTIHVNGMESFWALMRCGYNYTFHHIESIHCSITHPRLVLAEQSGRTAPETLSVDCRPAALSGRVSPGGRGQPAGICSLIFNCEPCVQSGRWHGHGAELVGIGILAVGLEVTTNPMLARNDRSHSLGISLCSVALARYGGNAWCWRRSGNLAGRARS